VAKEEVLTPETLAGLAVSKVKERSQYMNILLYGNSGVGKTTLAGSADEVPAMRPVLFIDVEGGTESLRHSYSDVRVLRVRNWTDMQNVYSELYKGDHPYQTVVLDSLTEIQKFNMYGIMNTLTQQRPDLDPDIPGMREWGKNIEQLRKMVRGFRDLPMNTIFTALVKSDKDARTGIIKEKPMMSGKLADEIAAFLDIVGYYYVKQTGAGEDTKFERILLTQSTEQQVAKDRSGKLPQIVLSPTMKDIWGLMTGTEA
jgi:AAA domain